MSKHPLRGSTAIVGVGLAGIGEAKGRSHLELMGESIHKALSDCGLGLGDVDGLWTVNMDNFLPSLTVTDYLGIRPKHVDGPNVGGASFLVHAISAASALHTGLCDVALICYGSNQRTGAGGFVSKSDPPQWEAPYKPRLPVTAYALAAARHMHQYGTTREQLAAVAVAARQWAQKNPLAFMRDPLTIEDVLKSRMIVDPLTVRDCCLATDGAGAVVMVRADRAKSLKKKPAYFLGGAAAQWYRGISGMSGDITVTSASDSGPRAFAMAGLKPSDVDVLELYDAFTINTILFLEDLGFCPKGEGGRFVADGNIGPGGKTPVNTNGGGLSCVHPGMYGIFTLIEATEQIRGEGGERQVPGVNVALAHGNGGTLSSQVTVLLGSESTL
ncbi:MAG: thiolase [Hyphomicrobiaceae bacterium]|nr:thiolase [Hyphomicrobiaceae bacterium]